MPGPAARPADAGRYYRHPDVRARLLEYCGGSTADSTGAVFVAGLQGDAAPLSTWDRDAVRVSVSDIDALCDRGCDLSRALWDRSALIFLFELDYENVDRPSEPYLRPAETFHKLEPMYRAVGRIFRTLAIGALPVATGRGYQFTGRIGLTDPLVARLAALAPDTPAWHAGVQGRLPAGVAASMSIEHARAWAGLGMLVEHAAHLVMRSARPASPIPVVFNGTIVGRGTPVGRECVSIDFSHFGDPLDERHVRAAFSAYQWHRWRPDIFGTETADAVPPLASIPRGDLPLYEFLARGRTLDAAARIAADSSVALPDVARGVGALLDDYAHGALAGFHRRFYDSTRAAAPGSPRLEALPPCLAAALEQPNDRLLKPEHVQHLVRGLLARDWTPGEIAALVCRKYEEDHGWGGRWTRLDPRTRAEFDVRVFCGMIATGLDALVDFNCVSAQEKDLCPRTVCRYDLRHDRSRLLASTLT